MEILLGTVLPLLGKIVIMVGIGFYMKKRGAISEDFQKNLTDFFMGVVVPCCVLATSGNEFTSDMSDGLRYTFVMGIGYYIVSILLFGLLSRHLPTSEAKRKAFLGCCVFANVGFIGFPVAQEIGGDEAMLYAVVHNVFYNLFMFSYGVTLFSGSGTRLDWKKMLLNRLTVVSVTALAIFLSPFRLPGVIQDSLDTVGGMMVPLSMILTGCAMAKMPFRQIIQDGYAYLVSLIRLLLVPLVLYFILRAAHIGGMAAVTAIVILGLPAGSLNIILAEQNGGDSTFASCAVTQNLVLMLVTLPFVIMLAMTLL
ncbi:MAG: AEC family transporter [Eubacteriales bacterium]